MNRRTKTVFTSADVLVLIQESPHKKFTRTMMASKLNSTHPTAGKWLQSLADAGLIDSSVEFGVWKYYALREPDYVDDDAPVVCPRSNTSSPLNRQNLASMYERIRRDFRLITLGTAIEVSPFWAA